MSDNPIDGYPFKLPTEASSLISRFGFSQQEASVFYGVRLDTVKKWLSGKMQMPDELVSESYAKLRTMVDLAEHVAEEYCRLASKSDNGGRNTAQYISLPTQEQLRRGFMPMSKGFYDNFFADVASRAYTAEKDRFCYVTPCEPEEEIGDTNFWVLFWVKNGLQMERCIEREDEIVRFDVDFYPFLEGALRDWRDVTASLIDDFGNGVLNSIVIDIPYMPEWYGEGGDLTDAELALVSPSLRISLPINGNADFSDVATNQSRVLVLVDDDEIRPMLEGHEGPDDADLNATNVNVAKVFKTVFGSRDALLARVQS